MIRILVAYVTAGTGHRRAAEALAQAARERFPHASVETVDALAGARFGLQTHYESSYLFLVRRAAWLWRFAYVVSDAPWTHAFLRFVRDRWNRWVAAPFLAGLKKAPPTVILCTHFLPANLCEQGRKRGWFPSRSIVVVTDWHPHQFWMSPATDATVVSSPKAAERVRRFGVPAGRVHVLGIPVDPAFSRPVDRQELLRKLDLDPSRTTVLVTSGGTTVGRFESVVRALAGLEGRLPGKLQLIVICGTDNAMRGRLSSVVAGSGMPIRVFGFVQNMSDLMAASDCIVAKAGGLTLSESLARGVPLILYHAIPGQEQANAEIAVEQGAALWEPSAEKVAESVFQLLKHPDRLLTLRKAANAFGHPDAARQIIQKVVAPLILSEPAP